MDRAAWSPSAYRRRRRKGRHSKIKKTADAPSVVPEPSFQRLPDLTQSHVVSYLPLYDLLRMSMVAMWLRVPCLKQITKLKLRYHADSSQEALNRLFQQLEDIELFVPDQRTVGAMESAVRDGRGGGVKELRIISNSNPDRWETAAQEEARGGRWSRDSFDTLWRALELLPSLSHLHLSFAIRRNGVEFGMLNAALAGGACPALEGLVLEDLRFHDSKVELAAAFEQRPKTCKRLLRLTLSNLENEEQKTLEAVERILLSHTCAELEQLCLSSCDGGGGHDVVATYLKRTGARKLQEALFHWAMLDGTVKALSEAAQSLTSVDLRGGFSEGSFLPLADAIRTGGAWDRLRVLQLDNSCDSSICRGDLDALFGAIGSSHGCPNLRELALNTQSGSLGAVASAIGMGAFRALETFRFLDGDAGEEEVAALEAALRTNPLPSLTALEIEQYAFPHAPLVRAFRGGACANLRRMYMYQGDRDLGELALVMKAGWGRQLRSLTVEASLNAIAAILEAVACSGACPALQELRAWIPRFERSARNHSKGYSIRVLIPKEPAHDAVVRNLATILSGGAACSSRLVTLCLGWWDINPEDMRVLSRALSLPTSAKIAILHLRRMERLGDDGARYLMRAMQRSLGMWLRKVDLGSSEYDRRLISDIDRWCPHLEEVMGHEDITARAQQRRVRMLW